MRLIIRTFGISTYSILVASCVVNVSIPVITFFKLAPFKQVIYSVITAEVFMECDLNYVAFSVFLGKLPHDFDYWTNTWQCVHKLTDARYVFNIVLDAKSSHHAANIKSLRKYNFHTLSLN